jgi:UDP-2,4-diacetamido-2,4,6-trideoxy-beta-L-altropyranose hydrolase
VTDIREEMQWADIAIAAAGSTAWELAFMGLPSLLIVVADNQHQIAAPLAQSGAAINLGWHNVCTPSDIAKALKELRTSIEMRRTMSQCGQKLVDGCGAARVVMAMTGDTLRLRYVRERDSHVLWQWANDPEARAVSFSSTAIPWQEHLNWFHSKVNNLHCIFFIATDSEDVPVGQVRYDLANDAATISVSLDRHQRSKGYGSLLLRLSAQALFATTAIAMIHAYVKPDNHASLRAFAKAEYTHSGTTETAGQPAVHFILRRSL